MQNPRFTDLLRLQYERPMTRVEQAELDLLSAEVTYKDRIDTGIPVNPDSARRIERLRKRFESLKGDTP